ncbi:hypothetical protein PVAG01_07209 [Phlyctema vagabunda]|uniref:Trafficking protein particle complex subunit 11 n=1 Tax=Phlyctema vagabunda TaxID=108571 RepID=A0ABR4PBW2_9HELO
MDGYDPDFVTHNLPLLVISGLGPEPKPISKAVKEWAGGPQIKSEIPPVQTEDALVLLKHFEASDGSGSSWNGREENSRNKFRVKVVGRGYSLPPRHILESSNTLERSHGNNSAGRTVLHSPLSPLSPGSRVFPDGLVDSKWVQKHQEIIPSAYISFYTLSAEPGLASYHDNHLKSDINDIKGVLSQSGYKTRHIVVLLSELKVQADVEERLASIRKATGLDPKFSLFFLPPQSSAVELQAFVETVLSTTYPLSIEYYRDLSKHSRRKRNRGVVPPPTAPPTSGTSQTLTSQGWNVRYDFKLGVFAEFRQEIDAAIRSYESGYEALLGTDVLESISSWSPRWNEARLLSDVFSIRILRCLLWNNNSTAAVRRWQAHRERIRDVVDRRGKGSSTYGWEAWEARWATVMAEMIQRSDISGFSQSSGPAYLRPEKNIMTGERLKPWEHLHHSGYWYRRAAKHVMARRTLALAIPEEDRSPPGESPASQIANKAYTYDSFLCPEPHEENPLPSRGNGIDHSSLIIDLLSKAIDEFEAKGQGRLVQETSLQAANESTRSNAWADAMRFLRPLWQTMSYREEGFWVAVEEIGWALRNAAVHAGEGGAIVAVDWELLDRNFKYQTNWHYDLQRSLEGLESIKSKPVVVLHDREVHSFLSGTFAFEHAHGKVGELCSAQLVVNSSAHSMSVPVTLTEIKVHFEGSIKPIILKHVPQDNSNQDHFTLNKVSLIDGHGGSIETSPEIPDVRPCLHGESDLTFCPGHTKVFEFRTPLREAGEAKATGVTFRLLSDLFDLDFVHDFSRANSPDFWWGTKPIKRRLVRANPSTITILPKPPRMDLIFSGLQTQYYTNEYITLQVEVFNGEEEDSITNLHLRIPGETALSAVLARTDAGTDSGQERDGLSTTLELGTIATGSSTVIEIRLSPIDLSAIYDISIEASYHLVSDLETPISRATSLQLSVINPFEANYDFSPRLHPEPWPSFFSHHDHEEYQPDVVSQAHGLAQKWCLTTRYASFATEDLVIEDIEVEVVGQNGGIQCYTEKITPIAVGGLRITPKSFEEAQFSTFTQKNSLDDRGTATLDVQLAIKWRRDLDNSALNTTLLPVPRLLVSSSEPRVLAAVSHPTALSPVIHFDVIIENPSNHFLTFGLTMEPSEEFAFSGTKQSTLQLVPLSRRTVRFRLLPVTRGDWMGPVQCVIRDRYFQKILKIAPTDGMKLDKEGILIWVPPEDD